MPTDAPFIATGPSTVLAVLITVVLLYVVTRMVFASRPRVRTRTPTPSVDTFADVLRPLDGHVHAFDTDDSAHVHRYIDARCRLCGYTQAQLDALQRFHARHQ